MRRIMILMAKQPAPGKTKTRLMPFLSAEEAAELYHRFLRDKITAMRQVDGVQCAIAYTPAEAEPFFAQLAPDFELILQQGADLPARLKHVFTTSFAAGYQQVVAIDGDSVTLPSDYLQQAFIMLDSPHAPDVVLGPCEDGGYYAIGMMQPHLTVFDVTMSTPNVTRDTLARSEEAHLSVSQLPCWYDIDEPTDLKRLLVDLNPDTPTYLYLKQLGKDLP